MEGDFTGRPRYEIVADLGRKYSTDQVEFGPDGFITIVPLSCSIGPQWEPKDVKVMIPVHLIQEIMEFVPAATSNTKPEPGMTNVQESAQL